MKSFTFFEEYYELITLLSVKEQQELSLAILKYMFEDEETELNTREKKVFDNLKRPLNVAKTNSIRRTKQEPIKNRLKTGEKPEENRIETETKPEENQNGTEKEPIKNQKGNRLKSHQDVYVYVNVIVKKVIDYLNNKTNSKYKYSSKTTQAKINARLNEGYVLDNFIAVIDKKCDEWIGTEFEQYLRPETLFGSKFESYLNQKIKPKKKQLETKPNWYGKEISEETATAEEINELNKKLRG